MYDAANYPDWTDESVWMISDLDDEMSLPVDKPYEPSPDDVAWWIEECVNTPPTDGGPDPDVHPDRIYDEAAAEALFEALHELGLRII